MLLLRLTHIRFIAIHATRGGIVLRSMRSQTENGLFSESRIKRINESLSGSSVEVIIQSFNQSLMAPFIVDCF